MAELKIIYIMGRGRSGSTFFENSIMKKIDVVCLGESRLWPKCYNNSHYCSCDKKKTDCMFWSGIIDTLPEKESIRESFQFLMSRKSLLTLFLPVKIIDRLYPTLRRDISVFYSYVMKVSHHSVFVDSSKNPAFGFLLSTIENIDTELCHLVRHPCAVAYSWKRQKQFVSDEPLYNVKKNIYQSSLEWLASNLLALLCKFRSDSKYYRINYEQLPIQLDMFVSQLDLQTENINSEAHAMSGNPGKAVHSNEFKEDLEWKSNLTLVEKITCSILTQPLYFFIKR